MMAETPKSVRLDVEVNLASAGLGILTVLECKQHNQHSPRPHQNHWHHIHPKGLGGKDVPANKVVLCPTGHYNVHTLLDLMLERGMANLPYIDIRTYTMSEIKLATLGYKAVMEYREEQERHPA
jgi:hypothetical protein